MVRTITQTITADAEEPQTNRDHEQRRRSSYPTDRRLRHDQGNGERKKLRTGRVGNRWSVQDKALESCT